MDFSQLPLGVQLVIGLVVFVFAAIAVTPVISKS